MPNIVEQRVTQALNRPIIYLCASGNPKSERMSYINWIRTNGLRKVMTVLYKQMSNRVIVGPKDFNLQCYVTDYDTITQEELDNAWENRNSEAKPVTKQSNRFETKEDKERELKRRVEEKFSRAMAENPFLALDKAKSEALKLEIEKQERAKLKL